MNEPWIKFFTGDYLRDPGVRSVSLAARGLWVDMLCLMHQSARKGYLQHPSGLPFTPVQLARMVGYGVEEIAPVLQELDDSGVFSRTKDGVIYSRRMDRDARKSAACSEAGRKGGGNPSLSPLNDAYKGEDKGASKGHPKGGVKPQSQSQSQITEPPNPQPSAGGDGGEFLSREEIWNRVCRIVGRNPKKPRSGLEYQFLAAVEQVSEADMAAVERYAALCRSDPQKYTKPKALAHTLLEEFHAEVGKATLTLGLNGHGTKKTSSLPADWPEFVTWLSAEYSQSTVDFSRWKSFTTWEQAKQGQAAILDDYAQWKAARK